MARDYSKNTSNFMSLGVGGLNAILAGASGITFAVWAQFDTFSTGATNNRIINEFGSGTTSSLLLNVGNATPKFIVNARSQSADSLQTKTGTTTITAGAWWHLAAVIDFLSGTVTPYVNGVAEGGGAATFGSTTYNPSSTTGHAAIGCGLSATPTPLTSADQVDGRLERLGIWRGVLSPLEIALLADGESLLKVRRSAMVGYYRLDGQSNVARNLVGLGPLGLVTGSVPYGDGPPVLLDAVAARVPFRFGGSTVVVTSKASSDAFSLSDAYSLLGAYQSSDISVIADGSNTSAMLWGGDPFTFVDAWALLLQVTGADAGSASDGSSLLGMPYGSDASAVADNSYTSASLISSEAYAFTDAYATPASVSSSVLILGSDVFAFTDGSSGFTASDAFGGTTGDTLATYSASWTKHGSYASGEAVITNTGHVRCSASPIVYYHATTPATPDYSIFVRMYNYGGTSKFGGPAARIDTAANTFYYVEYDDNFTVFRIRKKVAGTISLLASGSASVSVGASAALELRLAGTSLKLFVNGVQDISTTDSSITAAGKAGIYLSGTGTDVTASFPSVHLDDWSVVGGAYLPEFVVWVISSKDTATLYDNSRPMLAAFSSVDTATVYDYQRLTATVYGGELSTIADASALLAAFTSKDTATASDAWAVLATLLQSDAATASDSTSILAALSESDQAAASESWALSLQLSSSDIFAATQASSLEASLTYGDTATLYDTRTTLAILRQGDEADADEYHRLTALIRGSDEGSGDESGDQSIAEVTERYASADAFRASEAWILTAIVFGADSGTLRDSGGILAAVASDDDAEFSESSLISVPVKDCEIFAAVDAYLLGVTVFGSQVVTIAEARALAASVRGSDVGTLFDTSRTLLFVRATDTASLEDVGFSTVTIAGTQYHIYSNDGSGGPIDYGTVIATTGATCWTSDPLGAGHYQFAVRAFATIGSLEEQNIDAAVEVVIDGDLLDATDRPLPPVGLSARSIAGGEIELTWSYPSLIRTRRPTGFRVYQGTPAVSYGSPIATVPFTGLPHYRAVRSSLTDGSTYQFVVRSYNASAEETNTSFVSAKSKATGPGVVDGLTGEATARG